MCKCQLVWTTQPSEAQRRKEKEKYYLSPSHREQGVYTPSTLTIFKQWYREMLTGNHNVSRMQQQY